MQTKNKIVNCRTCLLTNKQYNKSELIRLVKVDGKLVIDKDQNMAGRGYWIKPDTELLKNPKAIQVLSKRIKCEIKQDLIDELINYEKR